MLNFDFIPRTESTTALGTLNLYPMRGTLKTVPERIHLTVFLLYYVYEKQKLGLRARWGQINFLKVDYRHAKRETFGLKAPDTS